MAGEDTMTGAAEAPYQGEIIQLPTSAASKARLLEAAQSDPVRKAEEALAKLSANFESWLKAQVQVLRAAYDEASAGDFHGDALKDFFRAAHDLRGQAATLGYPLAGEIAGSLCHLIDSTPASERLPQMLIRQHVEAIRAVVAEGASDENHAIGRRLATRLRSVTDEFVDVKRAAAG